MSTFLSTRMPSKGDRLKNAIWGNGWSMELAADKLEKSRTWLYGLFKLSDEKFDDATVQYVKLKLGIDLSEDDVKIHQLPPNGLTHTAKKFNIPQPEFVGEGSHFLPVYDLSNQDEILLDFTSRQDLILFYYSLPDFKDCPLAIIMVGNEMANLYKDGDKLLIDPYDKEDVIFGRPYLIFTKKFVVVRYIHTTPNDEVWLLKAENPKYDPFTLLKDKIDFLFQVKGHVSRGCY